MSAAICDVLVAGAGPAGAIAARQLALAGVSVVLVDGLAASPPKLGETLPGAGIRLLRQLGLGGVLGDESKSGRPIHFSVGGVLAAWSEPTFVAEDALRDPYGPGLRLDRTLFDAALRRASEDAGARLIYVDAAGLTPAPQGWNVTLANGAVLEARRLIDATGRRGRLARLIAAKRWRGAPLVALYRTGSPRRNGSLNRTVIASGPDGWIYAGALGDNRWAFGYHTTPETAAWLLHNTAGWEQIVSESVGLGELLGGVDFDPPVFRRDARSARLEPPSSANWVACGDAALAFDPIAGQGLFNAISTGKMAAAAVLSMLDGGNPSKYAGELAGVAEIYLARRQVLYRQERRWPERHFWRIQQR